MMSDAAHTPEINGSAVEAGSLAQYLNEIGRHEVPHPEEMASLAKRRAAMVAAQELLSSEVELTHISQEQENRLHIITELGHTATARLMEGNLRLVVSIAKKYTSKKEDDGPELLDLIGDGNTGLIRAVEKYDYTRGYTFSTYATWWIQQAISKKLGNHPVMMVRMPTDALRIRNKISVALSKHWPDDSFVYTDENIQRLTEIIGVSRSSQVQDILTSYFWFGARKSLNEFRHTEEEGETIEQVIPDTTFEQPEEKTVALLEREYLSRILGELSEKERDIIERRFGFDRSEPESLQSIGSSYGVTPERVRQIEKNTLAKLKTILTR